MVIAFFYHKEDKVHKEMQATDFSLGTCILCGSWLTQFGQNLLCRDDDAAAILELHQQFTCQNFLGQHPPLSLGSDNARSRLRQLFLKFLINVLLETQATL